MQEIGNDSSNKIINETSEFKNNRKSQTYIAYTENLFKALNNEQKKQKNKRFYGFKIKLNIFETIKDKKYNEKIDTFTQCELKLKDQYEEGFLKIQNNSLIILKNKIEEPHNFFISSDIGNDKLVYNNNSMNTNASSNLSISADKNKNINKNNISINNNYLLYLDFNLLTCKFLINKTKQKFRLLILGKQDKKDIYQYRVIKFRMLDLEKELFNNVCKNINNIILSSNGYKENIINASLNKYFCKDYFISSFDFYKSAKTCDIILFRSYAYCSKCQRCITKGHYDHIGLLIKKYNDLFVYESTGKDGVVLRRWYEFIYYYWFLLCDKMSFRKLIVSDEAKKKFIANNINETSNAKKSYSSGFSDSNVEIMSKAEIDNQFNNLLGLKFENFMEITQGKKYYFSILQYLFKGFNKNKITNNIKTNGYFCSELIAAVYNYCDIISNKINITNYLPSSFAENGDAAFNEGYNLGPEYVIIFS